MNALQDENDRLKVEVEMLDRNAVQAAAVLREAVARNEAKDALIKELREALNAARRENWGHHSEYFFDQVYCGLVPAPICKQIFEALHRKV